MVPLPIAWLIWLSVTPQPLSLQDNLGEEDDGEGIFVVYMSDTSRSDCSTPA
jgi:hypothetical protein